MIVVKAEDLDPILDWLRTCPCQYTVSSMQGGNVHVKFELETVAMQKVELERGKLFSLSEEKKSKKDEGD